MGSMSNIDLNAGLVHVDAKNFLTLFNPLSQKVMSPLS